LFDAREVFQRQALHDDDLGRGNELPLVVSHRAEVGRVRGLRSVASTGREGVRQEGQDSPNGQRRRVHIEYVQDVPSDPRHQSGNDDPSYAAAERQGRARKPNDRGEDSLSPPGRKRDRRVRTRTLLGGSTQHSDVPHQPPPYVHQRRQDAVRGLSRVEATAPSPPDVRIEGIRLRQDT
jgi:hypothetical protein